MQEVSYDWLRLVEKALYKIQQLPALEESFPFPWETASSAVGQALQLPELTLSSSQIAWKGYSELLSGLGDNPFLVSIEVAPIEGALFFAMSSHDVTDLISQTLVMGEYKESFANAKLKEGFYHFLLLKILKTLDQLKIFKEVTLHLMPGAQIPQENGFCVEIEASLQEKTLHGRLICPQSFLTAFKAYQPMQKTSLLSSNQTQNIELSLRCEVGYTSIAQDEWDGLQIGDFLVLDRCSYDPEDEKGSVTLLLGDTPLLIARMKSEGMKILDYAFYREEESSPEIAEEGVKEMFSEDMSVEETSSATPFPEFTLTAEVGHIRLPLNKLLYLQPGDMLDLIMRPEQGVDLSINGKKVGKGDLLKLGELVGIRILDIIR